MTSNGSASASTTMREDGSLVVRADVPGVKPEYVKIEVEILRISRSHEVHTVEQHEGYVRHERRCGSFSHSMALLVASTPSKSKPPRTTVSSK